MIAIVNAGGANYMSLTNALDRLNAPYRLSTDPAEISGAERVILPGVGSAGDWMKALRRGDLVEVLRGLTQPTLGICLGMQLLFTRSAEDDCECLGVLPGTVSRLAAEPGITIPHMGWNSVTAAARGGLFREIPDGSFFYFVHSYAAPSGEWVRATASHGRSFPAAVQKDNFYGVQFHPERSAAAGQRLLRNFLAL